ncbi:penicillin-binding protein, 1A family [Seinonella peptonophila]|uniref:Penicillin-binding protein, 1A family n=1 Tax=Seinonella peptonophila TaxID=112248 RepID=A0A1M4WWL9_9BACL|nr:PBP1A family penicillin-binding protein [Seinonella peptonophila]SHE85595.1 penicillin-binding protein, 1A family [Seinonella peptonophila]
MQMQRLRHIGFIILGIALLFGLFLLYLYLKPLPPPDLPMPSKIYDDQGKLIGQMQAGAQSEFVPLHRLPKHLIQATLAAEDESFYHHFGFSVRGIARAIWTNIKAGRITQGASTITQQLARNLYLTQDRTWSRKIKEAILTLQLELHYNKDQILEMYLNKINYGNGAYGVGKAARLYLGKDASKLNLAESTFLVGIPRGPALYSPYHHFERTKKRQQHILALMVEDHMITQSQAHEAAEVVIALTKPKKTTEMRAYYFRDYVLQRLVHKYGLEPEYVQSGGLHIYTTLNQQLQKQAETAVQRHLSSADSLQGALLSVDPHTGEIKAMVGGKDYRKSQFNRIFAKRQPGSTFKSILYLHALQQGYTPSTQIMSRPTSFAYEGGVYQPANFQNHYPNRMINLREAIARSDNIYAVTTLFQVGINSVIDLAQRLGMKSPLQPTPSLALGSYAVTPYELTEVYSTIANYGVHHDLTGIKRVVDANGEELLREHSKGTPTVSPAHSFVLTRLLTSVFEPGGTAYRVRQLFDQPAAGKTGSTDWDGWITGYTPNLTTTVWVGYDQNRKLPHIKTRAAQYIWGDYMDQASKRQKQRLFPVPAGVKSVRIDPETGFLATPFCPHSTQEYYVAGTEPHQTCPLHPVPSSTSPSQKPWWRRIFEWKLW